MKKLSRKLLFVAGLCLIKNFTYSQNLHADPRSEINQYERLLEEYKNGNRDTILLFNLANLAKKLKEKEQATIVANDYIKRIKSIYSSKNLVFIVQHTSNIKDPGFEIIKNKGNLVDSILGPNSSDNFVMNIIYKSEIEPKITNLVTLEDWVVIEKKIKKKYGIRGQEITWRAKMITYNRRKDWKAFVIAAIPYLKDYGDKQSGYDLNNFAWNIFTNLNDTASLKAALSWSKLSIEKENCSTNMDTYANLLYKIGKREEAIRLEEKVVDQADANDKLEFSTTLEKMKKGDPTWK